MRPRQQPRLSRPYLMRRRLGGCCRYPRRGYSLRHERTGFRMCGSGAMCDSARTIWRNGGERGCGGRGVHEVQPRVQRARCLSIDRQSTGGVLTNETSYRVEAAAAPATLGGRWWRAIRETMSDGDSEEDHPTPLRSWLALRAWGRLVCALACRRWPAGQASCRPDARRGLAGWPDTQPGRGRAAPADRGDEARPDDHRRRADDGRAGTPLPREPGASEPQEGDDDGCGVDPARLA